LYSVRSGVDWPTPAVKTAPLIPSFARPCRKSSAFRRAEPVFLRTADESSFSVQLSPAAVSNPAAAIRWRAASPASNQEPPPAATQALQPV